MRKLEDNEASAETLWKDPFLWFLIIVAFLFRLLYNLVLHPDGHPPSGFIIDEREYFGAAHMLAEGRGFSFFDTALWVRPPLYVATLAATVRLFGIEYLPNLLVQSLLSAATLLPLGWLSHRIGGLAAARCTVGLGTLYLPFTLFAGLLLSETLFVLLFSVAIALLFRAQDHLTSGWGRAAWISLVAAGMALGLATLTRSTALGAVFLAALWLAVIGRDRVPAPRRLLAAGVVLSIFTLTLLPWTLRNFQAYGRFVPVDTTSGYNLWLGSVGVRDEERLQAELRPVSNPADRQTYALSRAWENIRRDFAGFVAKGLKESFDLWKPLFSAEERQVQGYSLGRVPTWNLITLLLLDDFLYAAILALAVVGLALTPPHPLKSLTALMVVLWVVLAFVFFAVTRFRLPLVAALLPWAGAGAATIAATRSFSSLFGGLSLRKCLAMVSVLILVLFVTLPNIAYGDTALGIERWAEQEPFRRAEALLKEGNLDAAIENYRLANGGLFDTRYGLAAALLQKGDVQEALAQLRTDEPAGRYEPFIIRGEAARMAGDLRAARSFFNSREVQVAGDEALGWAWDHMRPPLTVTLEIGGGLDVGYIRGFYGPETDEQGVPFRWTGPESQVRYLVVLPDTEITWSGWRPDALPPAQVIIERDRPTPASIVTTLANKPDWQMASLDPQLSPSSDKLTMERRLSVNPFVAAGSDPRLLGVRIASIGVDR